MLTSLALSHNPRLVYIHRSAIQQVPVLRSLNLSNNNLTILEDIRYMVSITLITTLTDLFRPGLSPVTRLELAGNPLSCHCSSSWISETSAASVPGCRRVKCDYKPYILPLLPAQLSLNTGKICL